MAIYVHMLCVGVSCPVIQVTHFPRVNHAATVAGGSKVSRNNRIDKKRHLSIDEKRSFLPRQARDKRKGTTQQPSGLFLMSMYPSPTHTACNDGNGLRGFVLWDRGRRRQHAGRRGGRDLGAGDTPFYSPCAISFSFLMTKRSFAKTGSGQKTPSLTRKIKNGVLKTAFP